MNFLNVSDKNVLIKKEDVLTPAQRIVFDNKLCFCRLITVPLPPPLVSRENLKAVTKLFKRINCNEFLAITCFFRL